MLPSLVYGLLLALLRLPSTIWKQLVLPNLLIPLLIWRRDLLPGTFSQFPLLRPILRPLHLVCQGGINLLLHLSPITPLTAITRWPPSSPLFLPIAWICALAWVILLRSKLELNVLGRLDFGRKLAWRGVFQSLVPLLSLLFVLWCISSSRLLEFSDQQGCLPLRNTSESSLHSRIPISFPSLAEAKVYCAAVGIALPEEQ